VLSHFTLIPLCCGQKLPSQTIAHILIKYIDDSTLLVVSSDLSHYLPENEAVQRDNDTIASILSRDDKRISFHADACGIEGIKIVNVIANLYKWQPHCMYNTTSAQANGDVMRVVGYGGFIYV
jgi:AmmeMemoRadiSam system protein B